ncbi:MAG: hypothetical protein IT328_12895 [Caldilineaceae bacterium]|nr:hypothetical protein [Caldilineaceae bacterium]
MEQTTTNVEVAPRDHVILPYSPSWVDRLTASVERLPGPAWLYYLAAMALFSVAYFLVKWWESGLPVLFSRTILLTIISAFGYLGTIHYLDKIASDAMARFRPAIEAPARRVADLEYRLTTMPARMVWLMTLLGALAGTLVLAGTVSGVLVYPGFHGFASMPAAVLEVSVVFLVWIFFITCAYHTVHQLHTVNIIYTELTKVDLFNQGPLHAFARLAAYTAIALTIPQYLWFTAGLTAAAFGVALGFLCVAIILGAITFFWPLYGIHRLLAAKKDKLQCEASRRQEKSLQLFAQAFDKEEMAAMGAIGDAIRNAENEQQIVAAIPTWPWPPGLLRGAMTAVFLPLIIWAATRILERFFGP